MSFDDSILLRINRQYSHEEAVAYLIGEVKRLKFENGELKSERDELKYELERKEKITKQEESKTAKQWNQEEFVKELRRTYEAKIDNQVRWKREMEKWRDRYLAIKNPAGPSTKQGCNKEHQE